MAFKVLLTGHKIFISSTQRVKRKESLSEFLTQKKLIFF
jgi:hypothetical protein